MLWTDKCYCLLNNTRLSRVAVLHYLLRMTILYYI